MINRDFTKIYRLIKHSPELSHHEMIMELRRVFPFPKEMSYSQIGEIVIMTRKAIIPEKKIDWRLQ